MTWNVVGVPVDCIGADPRTMRAFGTELSPAALRDLGVVERVGGLDRGDLDVRVVGRERDPATGIVGGTTVHDTVRGVRQGVRELLDGGDRLLLLGGCCIPPMGALAGARDARGEVGLLYIDGHLDLYDNHTSPTGEGADMPVAACLGIGEPGLLEVMGAPVVAPEQVALLGPHDPVEWPALGHLVDELDLFVADPSQISEDPDGVAAAAAARADRGSGVWVHLDVDVFDQAVFPATDYLMPAGLSLEVGGQLVASLASAADVVGISLGCYNPEKDSAGANGRDLVELAGLLTGG